MDYVTSTPNPDLLAVEGNKEALQCLGNLHSDMETRHWSAYDVARHSGIKPSLIHNYTLGVMIPTVRNYNRLARLFGWKLLAEKHVIHSPKAEKWRSPRSRHTPEVTPVSAFKFKEGICYIIREKNSLPSSSGPEFIFCYVEKRGIHHVFREIRGGWQRTYTDIQLIGKRIYETRGGN